MTSEMLFLLFSKNLLPSLILMKQKRAIFASNQRMERMNSLFHKNVQGRTSQELYHIIN